MATNVPPTAGPRRDLRWVFYTALVVLVLVLVVTDLVIYMWSHRNDDGGSTGFLNVTVPIIGAALVGVLGFLGVNRLRDIDSDMDKRVKEGIDKAMLATRNDVDKAAEAAKADLYAELGNVREQLGPLKKVADELDSRFGSTSVPREIVGGIGNVREAMDFFEKRYESLSELHRATILDALVEEVESGRIIGDSADYHNLAVALSRKDFFDAAVRVTKVGVERFGSDMDLMCDLIQYRRQVGDFDGIEDSIDRLKRVYDPSCWNWRAFTFAIDALNSLPPADARKATARKKEVLGLVAEYKRVLPSEERAFYAEYETCTRYGEHDRAIKALNEAEDTLLTTSQCSLQLARLHNEAGRYAEAIASATRAIASQARTQLSSSTGAAFAYRALSRDGRLHRAMFDGVAAASLADEVQAALSDYQMAHSLGYHQLNLQSRMTILKALLGDGRGAGGTTKEPDYAALVTAALKSPKSTSGGRAE